MFDLIGQLILGWLTADLLSGLFHWWQDRWPPVTSRWIGNYFIAPSRLHHRKPSVFAQGSFIYRNGATVIGTLITSLILLPLLGPTWFLFSLTLGGLVSTQVHYLAHCPSRTNRLGRMLQVTGLIQSPKHHARHHRSPHERRYCVLTDFVNPLLDELKVWNKLESFCISKGCQLSLGAD